MGAVGANIHPLMGNQAFFITRNYSAKAHAHGSLIIKKVLYQTVMSIICPYQWLLRTFTVNPRISPLGAYLFLAFLDGGLFEGGLYEGGL